MSQALAPINKVQAAVALTPSMAELYRQNAGLGMEHLNSAIPALKIYTANKTKDSELITGEALVDGNFFHPGEAKQWKTVEAHILSVSKGFHDKGIGENSNKQVFTQVFAGVIVNDGDTIPFVFYLTGKKLSPFWEYAKSISVYTKNKQFPIPLCALKVEISTVREKNDYGTSWVPTFRLVTNDEGVPAVVSDEGVMQFLLSMTQEAQTFLDEIASKGLGEDQNISQANTPKPIESYSVPTREEPPMDSYSDSDFV